MASNIHEKEFLILETISDCNDLKFWSILSLQASDSAPASGNSLVDRRVSRGRKRVVLYWTNYAVPQQIKPRILK